MATLTVQEVNKDGLEPTYSAAASGGDTFNNDSDRKFLHVKNGDASSKTVTIAAIVSETERPGFGTLAVADISVSVPAGSAKLIGPIPRTAYGTQPDIQYSAITSVTVAALELK